MNPSVELRAGILRALGKIQGARRAAALRGRGRLPAGRLLCIGAEDADDLDELAVAGAIAGGPINVVRARPSTSWCRPRPRS
jgi:hypothetical protein